MRNEPNLKCYEREYGIQVVSSLEFLHLFPMVGSKEFLIQFKKKKNHFVKIFYLYIPFKIRTNIKKHIYSKET